MEKSSPEREEGINRSCETCWSDDKSNCDQVNAKLYRNCTGYIKRNSMSGHYRCGKCNAIIRKNETRHSCTIAEEQVRIDFINDEHKKYLDNQVYLVDRLAMCEELLENTLDIMPSCPVRKQIEKFLEL